MKYDHLSEGSKNDLKYPGTEMVNMRTKGCKKVVIRSAWTISCNNPTFA